MKGYKLVNKDLSSKYGDMVYKVGETYSIDEQPILCKQGFHFCDTPDKCYQFYSIFDDPIMLEVEALGTVISTCEKCVTNKIKIVRKLSYDEYADKMNNSDTSNYGSHNSGTNNVGHWNVGERNRGSYNFGHHNNGDSNCGAYNKGYWNIGDKNIGVENFGFSNKGDRNRGENNYGTSNFGFGNTGNNNFGEYNCGDEIAGFFSTKPGTIQFFNHSIPYNEYSRIARKYINELSLAKCIIDGVLIYTDTYRKRLEQIPYFDEEVFQEIMKGYSEK